MSGLEVSIAPELAGKVRLGVVAIEGVTVEDGAPALAAEIEAVTTELRSRYGGSRSAEVPGAAEARTLYKALGLDPTKTRPSNEALLRRVLLRAPRIRPAPAEGGAGGHGGGAAARVRG